MRVTAQELLESGPTLSAGVLSADLLHLEESLTALDEAGIRTVHVDVMDGAFCPLLTVGPPLVRAIPDRFILDCHLMIQNPLDHVESFIAAGASIVTFHPEAAQHPHRVLQALHGRGVVRGVALLPGTPLEVIDPLLDEMDLLLLLAVNPGWSGQAFIASTERRMEQARARLAGRRIALGVDGGVTQANIEEVARLGAHLVVSGSAIFEGSTPVANATALLGALRRGQPAAITARVGE